MAFRRCLIFAVWGLSCLAWAQPSGTVLNENEVTEDVLKEMLAPERHRSIVVRPTRPPDQTSAATQQPAQAAQRPSASILITFETNSATLTSRARQSLDVVGRALASSELEQFLFVIEGHADPRGNPDSNLRLSQARAESVRQYLTRTHGIPLRRLNAIGKGDREVINTSNPAAPENRRVTIVNASY